MRKTILLTVIGLCLVLLLFGCTGKKVEFSIPDQKSVQGESVSLDLTKFAKNSTDAQLYFSLIQGIGRVMGQRYELVADSSLSGSYEVTIVALTKGADPVQTKFKVTVERKDFPPIGKIPNLSMAEGEVLSIPLIALISDPEGSPVDFSLAGEASESFARIESGVLHLSATYKEAGENNLKLKASDPAGNSSEIPLKVKVTSTNRPPNFEVPPLSVQENRTLTLDLSEYASDPDGEKLSFSLAQGSAGSLQGSFYTYQAETAQEQPVSVTLRASDPREASAEATLNITVLKAPESVQGVITVGALEGQYETIQEAINAAAPGDTVLILPGLYKENIVISKNIHLSGTSPEEVTIRPESAENPAVFIRGVAEFSLESIRVESGNSAINVSRSSGEIANCFVAGGRFAISYSGSGTTLKLSDSYITSLMGLDSEEYLSTRLVGVYAYSDAKLIVEKTTFERTGTGASLSNDLQFVLLNNTFKRNTVGVSLNGTASGSLIGNTITENVDNGVLINITSTATLSENVFYANVRHGLDLYLKNCTDCGCGGSVFKGTVVGSDNVFDTEVAICPRDYWDESFYSFDPTLAGTPTN